MGQRAVFLIENVSEGKISTLALKGFEDASQNFDWWFERYCAIEPDPDHGSQAAAGLIHHAIGLNSEMKNSLDAISLLSISDSELNQLLDTLQWWGRGLRQFLRGLSPIEE